MSEPLRPREAKQVEEAIAWALAQGKTLETDWLRHQARDRPRRAMGCDARSLRACRCHAVRAGRTGVVRQSRHAAHADQALVAEQRQQLAFEPMDYGPLWTARLAQARSAARSPPTCPARVGSKPARPAIISSGFPLFPAAARRSNRAAAWSRTSPATIFASSWPDPGARWRR